MQNIDLKKRVINAIGWSTAAKILAQSFSWFVTLLVIRKLSPDDYGLMAIAMATFGVFIALGSVGLADAVKQAATIPPGVLRQIFGVNLGVALALMTILVVAAYPIAALYDDPRLAPMIMVIGLNLLVYALTMIPKSLVQKKLEFKRALPAEVAASVTWSLTTLILAYSGWGVWSLVIGMLLGNCVNMIGYLIIEPFLQFPEFRIEPQARRMIRFGAMRTIEQIAWYTYASADIFIVGKILGPLALGFYNVASTIALMPINKIAPIFNPVVFSAFALVQDRRREASFYFLKGLRVLSIIAFPALFGLSAVSPELVLYVLGNKWEASTFPMQVLSLAGTLIMIGLVVSPFLQGIGEVGASLRNTLVGLIVLPAAIAIGCNWGTDGAAVAWAIAYPFYFLHNIWRAARISSLPLSQVLSCMRAPFLAASVMYIAVRAVSTFVPHDILPGVIYLMLLIVLGASVYLALIFLLRREALIEIFSLIKTTP